MKYQSARRTFQRSSQHFRSLPLVPRLLFLVHLAPILVEKNVQSQLMKTFYQKEEMLLLRNQLRNSRVLNLRYM